MHRKDLYYDYLNITHLDVGVCVRNKLSVPLALFGWWFGTQK